MCEHSSSIIVGFSTGALAHADLETAMRVVRDLDLPAVEVSALRAEELERAVAFVEGADWSSYRFHSFHLPSKFDAIEEKKVVELVRDRIPQDWPLVAHPDTLTELDLWRSLGSRLTLENMDIRKPIGRTFGEMAQVFETFPEARFCFDIGHAYQVDPSLREAARMLRGFGSRISHWHASFVDAEGRHHSLDGTTQRAMRPLWERACGVPIILEADLSDTDWPTPEDEVRTARVLFEEDEAHEPRFIRTS